MIGKGIWDSFKVGQFESPTQSQQAYPKTSAYIVFRNQIRTFTAQTLDLEKQNNIFDPKNLKQKNN